MRLSDPLSLLLLFLSLFSLVSDGLFIANREKRWFIIMTAMKEGEAGLKRNCKNQGEKKRDEENLTSS